MKPGAGRGRREPEWSVLRRSVVRYFSADPSYDMQEFLLGGRLSLYIGWGRTFNPEAKVIQMDKEPEEIGRNKPADLPIFSDINRAIIKLNSSIGDNFDFSKWLTACENWKKEEWAEVDKLKASDEKPLHVLRVVKAIEDYFGNEAMICIDGGDTQAWTCLLYTSPSPRDRQKSRMPSSA